MSTQNKQPGMQRLSEKKSAAGERKVERGDLRRQQVLNAATECFRQNGFHSTSMAEVSKEAGMSVGHIYHYFDSKESIIAAIVERHVSSMLGVGDHVELQMREGNLVDAITSGITELVTSAVDSGDASLMLEITAEAARNEKVAAIMRDAYKIRGARLRDILKDRYRASDVKIPPKLIDAQVEVMRALSEGLKLSIIGTQKSDMKMIEKVVRQAVAGMVNNEPCD
jgi:AcrR family transcriptional regulator